MPEVLTVVCLTLLVGLTVRRWLKGDWLPVHSEHVPLDFASLTINGIPIEVLYGPDAVKHTYPLSEPLDLPPWLIDQPIVPLLDPEASWRESTAMLQAQWRIGAGLPSRVNPFHIITGC